MKNKNIVQLSNGHHILDNLNVTYNASRNCMYLWNKYQIFVLDAENVAIELVHMSNNLIAQLFSFGNHLFYREATGVVRRGLLSCPGNYITVAENAIFLTHAGQLFYYLSVHINKCVISVFNSHHESNSFEIDHDDNTNRDADYSRCRMHCHLMNAKETLVIISFNGHTVNYFNINNFDKRIKCVVAKKLLNCPSQINDIHVINNNILISLSIGTLIKINRDTETFKRPEIIHLNTAIHKILLVNESLIYTNGQTMWRVDNIFNNDNVKYRQFFVKLIKDFTYHKDGFICTTYSKHLYEFSIDDEKAYLQPASIADYCPANRLLKDEDCMEKIALEIEKNNEITKKIKMEENYITTIALSNRQDIVNDLIKYDIAIHERYEDVVKNYNMITLTNDIRDYYFADSFYLLVKLNVSTTHQKFNDILSNLYGNMEMHITLFSIGKVLKTITLKILEQLKSMNIVVPLPKKLLTDPRISVVIKLVTSIPGALDHQHKLWINLHTKETILNSEHFIKTIVSTTNVNHLKKTPETINNLIYESAIKHHGNLVKFINTNNKQDSVKWQFFVKLPKNYKEILKQEEFYKCINSLHRKLWMSEISSDRFLKSGNTILLNVANEKVEIDIDEGFSNAMLKTTCANLQIASDIRNFLSNLLHTKQEATKDFVSNTIFSTMENIEQQISEFAHTVQPVENFLPIHEKFQKNVIIALNI